MGLKPYYEDNAVKIFLGDCREILPQLEPVDLVLTDPPYGLANKWAGGAGGKSSWKIPAVETHSWDKTTVDLPIDIFSAKQIIIWGGNYYSLPLSRGWLIWDKKQPDNWTTGQAELAWTNMDRPIKVYRMAACEAEWMNCKDHPTQKPIELMSWCMKWLDSGPILDPFMGSGTTLRAAKDLGRKAIGIEIEEKYCEISALRMQQEVLPLGLEKKITEQPIGKLID